MLPRISRTLLVAAWACMLLSAAQATPGWRFQRTGELRSVIADGRADTPDGPVDARLVLFCREGKGGWIGLDCTFHRPAGSGYPQGTKGFHFDDFEGPDAPALRRRLTRLAVTGGARPFQVTVAQSGSLSSELQGFTFTAGGPNTGPNPVKRLLRSVVPGSGKLTVSIQDSQDPKALIRAEFPATGLSSLVGQLLKDY
jgi:hypothetical protein